MEKCTVDLAQLSDKVKVCGKCFHEETRSGEDGSDTGVVDWIECSNCSLWLHMNCANVSERSNLHS